MHWAKAILLNKLHPFLTKAPFLSWFFGTLKHQISKIFTDNYIAMPYSICYHKYTMYKCTVRFVSCNHPHWFICFIWKNVNFFLQNQVNERFLADYKLIGRASVCLSSGKGSKDTLCCRCLLRQIIDLFLSLDVFIHII